MATKHFGPLNAIERCSNCHGIWITAPTLRKLTELPMSDILDVGNPNLGARYDEIDHIDCPRCAGQMLREHHPTQPHIGYEHCRSCDAYFLDAGELTDIKHYTVGEWFKNLLRYSRPG